MDKSMKGKSNSLGARIRQIRESKNLLLRQVAAALEVDTAFLSKVERGEKVASKEHVKRLSVFLNSNFTELHELWLIDKLMDTLDGEKQAENVLKQVTKMIKTTK